MFIDKEIWEKLKENIDGLYWDVDRMSRDGRYFLKQIDINIKDIEKKSLKIKLNNNLDKQKDDEVSI